MRGGWSFWGLAVALLGLVAYLPVLFARFTSDDFTLLHAVRIRGPLGLWADAGSEWFRPLISLSLWVDDRMWHGAPGGFHATNLLAHALCALLVGVVAAQLLRSRGSMPERTRQAPLLAGAFFLVLPSHSEAVSWVSGRTDVLATLFALGAVGAFLRAGGSRIWAAASLLLLALALFSKESTVVLPLVFLVLSFVSTEKGDVRRRRSVALVGASLAVMLLALLIRRVVLGRWVGGYGAEVHMNLDPRVPVMNLVLFPLRALLPHVPLDWLPKALPLAQAQDAFHHVLRTRSLALWLAALVGVVVLMALAWWGLRRPRNRLAGFAPGVPAVSALACAILLVPVLTMRVSLVNTQGERFLYLPSAFLCVWLATLLARGIHSAAALTTVASALVLLGSSALLRQNRDWQSAGDLYARVVAELGETVPAQTAVLLNLPDHLNGAYVFRNGLTEACAMQLGARAPSRITVAAFHTLSAVDDRVSVSRTTDGFAIRLANTHARFLPRDASSLRCAVPPGLCVEPDGPRSLRLTFDPGGAAVACVSDGRLRRLTGRARLAPTVDTQ